MFYAAESAVSPGGSALLSLVSFLGAGAGAGRIGAFLRVVSFLLQIV